MATLYLVLKRNADAGEYWETLQRVEAATADAAIRAVSLTQADGTYVAVPARSWQPRTVKVEARASFAKDTP